MRIRTNLNQNQNAHTDKVKSNAYMNKVKSNAYTTDKVKSKIKCTYGQS